MYFGKRVIHIVACDHEGGIGKNNEMIWNFKEDFKFFRESTLGHSLLMGRKTIESLPKMLDRRMITGVTRSTPYVEKFDMRLFNFEDGLEQAFYNSNLLKTDCIFIAGGAEIYATTRHIVDEVWMTEIEGQFEADAFYEFPSGDFVKRGGPMYLCKNHVDNQEYLLKFVKYFREGLDGKD